MIGKLLLCFLNIIAKQTWLRDRLQLSPFRTSAANLATVVGMEPAGFYPGVPSVHIEWPRTRFSRFAEVSVYLFPLFTDLLVLFSNKQSQLVAQPRLPLFPRI